jgi:hypothetical protein
VIAVDTNILVYAHRAESHFHNAAQRALRTLAGGDDQWAIPWPCFHEFLNVVTHRRIFKSPTPLDLALEAVATWLLTPNLLVLSETEKHWPTLEKLLVSTRVVGPRVHDARIAGICLQHGVQEIWSADRDFVVFSPLRAINPLVT